MSDVALQGRSRPEGECLMFPAINARMLTGSCEGWPLADLAAAGYGGLELTPACLENPAVLQAAAEAAMPVVAVNAMAELRPYLTGSLSDNVAWRRQHTLDRLMETLCRMRHEGIPTLVVAPSRLAEIYQTPDEARALLVDSLCRLADAGDTQVLLQAAPFRLFAGAVDIASIVDEVARPNVGAALDLGHALLADEDPAQAAVALGARLRYATVCDADIRPGVPRLDRHLPLGQGSLTRDSALAAIEDRPWTVSICAPGDPLAAARDALAWLAAEPTGQPAGGAS